MEKEQAKRLMDCYLDEQMDVLWDMARYIHANPELGFQEFKAAEVQCDFLEQHGFQVERKAGTLDTAFKASYGTGKTKIAIVSEYDALPEIGHACGHNLISTSAVGAAIGVKQYMEENQLDGTIYCIGTPAEEGGGGKIILLEQGVFDGMDAVIMMHPTSAKTRLAGECMSSMRVALKFHGLSAHAGSHPENGVNALSAANLYLTAVGLLRQHVKGDMRISHIIKEGGKGTGLIPDEVVLAGSISCFSVKDLERGAEKLRNAALGCAQALGCTVDISITPGYQGRIPNKTLSDVCKEELHALNEELMDGMPFDYGGEDLGNVSRIIPICNPYVTIFPDYKISNHTEQFRELANSGAGRRCLEISSKSMARTAVEFFLNPQTLEAAKQELTQRLLEGQ